MYILALKIAKINYERDITENKELSEEHWDGGWAIQKEGIGLNRNYTNMQIKNNNLYSKEILTNDKTIESSKVPTNSKKI